MQQYKKKRMEETNYSSEDVFIKRIPNQAYKEMIDVFSEQYHFNNGERMRIANYYVGISQRLANIFNEFIEEINQGIVEKKYPQLPTPEGFEPHSDNLLPAEQNGLFTFASFDMAVMENSLQNIEFQAVSTYPVSAAKLNQILLQHLQEEDAYIFADNPTTTWKDFTEMYEEIIADNQTEGIVLTDRLLKQQKTSFEFYATQKELNTSIEIVDMEDIEERDNRLFYTKNGKSQKINRLYNRILLAEALFEDNYPNNTKTWKFRFDKSYKELKFINHPVKLYEVSKRLSPYISHQFNPTCYELSEVAEDFRKRKLKFKDYVWKHKWGGAGHRLILSPNFSILEELSDNLEEYIAQKKVNFKLFKTDDGQEKIVELRFMTAIHNNNMIIVPMARLGHITQSIEGVMQFKIHFGENNKEGYGFSPVVIFKEKSKKGGK
ncbi:MAG: hypothetical protein AB8G11_06600 [Saprospiraceae bacterium]